MQIFSRQFVYTTQGLWYFVRLRSREIQVNPWNSQKHTKYLKILYKSYQIDVCTTYLKLISAKLSWNFVTKTSEQRPDVTVICVSPWYVHPRTHIPSDMCIPPIWLLVKCVSPTPHPLKQVSALFLLFLWILWIMVKGTTRQKSNDSRQNNHKAVSGEFTSSWAAMLM